MSIARVLFLSPVHSYIIITKHTSLVGAVYNAVCVEDGIAPHPSQLYIYLYIYMKYIYIHTYAIN